MKELFRRFSMFVLGALFLVTASGLSLLPQSEIAILKAIYDSMAGQDWLWRVDETLYGVPWNFSTNAAGQYLADPCINQGGGGWQGVQCSSSCTNASVSCHVNEIVLDDYGLNGTLPVALTALHLVENLDLRDNPSLSGVIPGDIGNMTSLTSLQIHNAQLSGTLPSSLGELINLEVLTLNINSIGGTIPEELSRLTNLVSLKLYSNELAGAIPDGLGVLQRLQYFYLYNNYLSSTVPSSLGLMASLTHFILYNNQLVGTIPSSLGDLVNLQYFYLNDNEITGSIPASLGNLSALYYLWVHTNRLTGTLPTELAQLYNLYYLAAHKNNLQGTMASEMGSLTGLKYLYLYSNSLSGTIPHEFSGMRNIQYMYLYENRLRGSIPSSLRSLTKLKNLRLYSNYLSGSLPSLLPIALDYLDVEDNRLNGSLPVGLSALPHLEIAVLKNNHFTGTLPVQLSQLTKLRYLYMDSNSISGTIPTEYAALTMLEYLSFAYNKLTGSIPSDVIGNLTSLLYLDLNHNSLSSTLPTTISKLQNLRQIWFHENFLTGTLPVDIFYLPNIEIIWLHINLLSGSIPPEVGMFSSTTVDSFFLSDNLLTSTLPIELFQCTSLFALMLDNNLFSSTIPADVGNLTLLGALYFHSNFFSGPIPTTIGQLTNLYSLELSINMLSGTLPSELGSLVNLIDILLSDNSFSGSPDLFVGDQRENMSLQYFDANNNKFSGQLSNQIFKLPRLKMLSLSINCFTGKFPENICINEGIEFLAMDSLAASSRCPKSYSLPFSRVRLFNTLEGSVPNCVFSLEKLTSLYLMGNGLTGSLSADLPLNSSLQHLILSHNDISGSIPLSIQRKTFETLDLSYNKITGTFDHYEAKYNQSELVLQVNRLSGNILTSALAYVASLKVLQGNMFGCENIPSNDEHYREFSCGSAQLNDALYVWELMVGCVALYTAVTMRAKWCPWCFQESTMERQGGVTDIDSLQKFNFMMRNSLYMMFYPFVLEVKNFDSAQKVVLFCKSLYSTMRVGVLLSIMSVVVFIPLYGLKFADINKEVPEYTTHSNTYGYLVSMAYISGQTPAVLLLVGWTLLLFMYAGLYFWIKARVVLVKINAASPDLLETENDKEYVQKRSSTYDTIFLITILGINSIIVGTVNALYLYSMIADIDHQVRVYVQVIMSIFSFLYNLICVPFLAKHIKVPERNCLARLLMIILNNIFIPCLMTAFSSPSCFQGVFVEVDSISPEYIIPRCSFYEVHLQTGVFSCTAVQIYTFTLTPLVPPFSYKFQCSSLLLSYYIPVYFYVSAFEIFFVFVLSGCLLLRKESYIRRLSESGQIGILWPDFWSRRSEKLADETDMCIAKPELLLNTVKIATNDIVRYGAIQLTFGLTSPALTIAVLISFSLKLFLWMVMLGRFLYHRINVSVTTDDEAAPRRFTLEDAAEEKNLQLNEDNALVVLGDTYLDIATVFASCFWPIVNSSSCFIAALCWDMAADKAARAKSALWAPLTALSMPLLLWIVDVGLTHGYTVLTRRQEENSKQRRNSDNSIKIEIVATSLNPLSVPNEK